MSENSESRNKILLTLLNGTGYVFNADDYMELRKKHRIVGALVGTSSTKGWSVNEATLPVELTTIETRLLVDTGIAMLVSKKSLIETEVNKSLVQKNMEIVESDITVQPEAFNTLKEKHHKIVNAEFNEGTNLHLDKLQNKITTNVTVNCKDQLVQTFCEHYKPHIGQIVNLSSDNSLRYAVFRHFWQLGKYVTAGDAFGADFLVYPGDPVLFHASHIIILLQKPATSPLDLITKVRISVVVNKICVFAYFIKGEDSSELPKVQFQTVVWNNAESSPVSQ